MMESKDMVVDWDYFKRVFLEKYFPDSVRYAKEAEFMRLQQGNMSVSKYAMRFKQLARLMEEAHGPRAQLLGLWQEGCMRSGPKPKKNPSLYFVGL
uniref:Retrotransposon gag domain-containing protein n=1 Tax=Cajanus cajan TaxID=3821 RepID=A0A151QLK9_CAJCA|nr:hypothetical protein KK1_048763 [Cajanus cajan]